MIPPVSPSCRTAGTVLQDVRPGHTGAGRGARGLVHGLIHTKKAGNSTLGG